MEEDVDRVATDNATPKNPGASMQPPACRAEIKLAAQQLLSPSGGPLSLTPGMLVAAEIRQRDRTVFEYLLPPIERIAKEAGRER